MKITGHIEGSYDTQGVSSAWFTRGVRDVRGLSATVARS